MTAAQDTAATSQVQAGTGPGPRLLAALTGPDLAAHHAARGALPALPAASALIELVEASGLTGRGGAAFPTHRKLRAVASGEHPVVVANGSEGEPASGKDRVLLVHVPHLVLDGIQVACHAVGARSAYLYVPREPDVTQAVSQALDERRRHGADATPVEIVTAPPRFVAGQESAAVARVGGAPAVPRSAHPPVYARGVRNRPTLVQNVETLAHLALLARYGASWFRTAGTPAEPGTMLFTIGGAVAHPGVVEEPIGVRLTALLDLAAGPAATVGAVLVGGYHGAWVPAAAVQDLTMSAERLRPLGGSVGAGVVAVLPSDRCGLVETARVVRYLASESTGQCGPCVNGLPAVADALSELAGLRASRPARLVRADVEGWSGLVVGRGACAHPDGTVRLVRSALQVFAGEIAAHERGGCTGTSGTPVLPLPAGPRPTDWW
jgi:NADH:ubiquinone oxidoreductase subunit F (NADH-binding)